MTELIKSRWESEGDNLRFSVPLTKVDKKNRLVSGWATLDNVDSQGDIVTAEASTKAFSRARGNLREMHQPIAVGKIVDFREDEFYNEQDGKFYRGIFVTARVSEGAEDTWKKVLDETLTGFSIGGSIIDASNEMSKDGSGQVRIVKDYDLVELSLVDNPANQLANIFSFTKTASGSVNVEGMLAETKIENVFMCKKDGNIKSVGDTTADCPECGSGMENIGWFESGDNRAEKVRAVINKFKTPTLNEGGEEMTTKNENNDADGVNAVVDAGHVEDVEDESTAESAEVEEVEEDEESETNDDETVEEVVDEEETISKKIDELKDAVTETLEKTREETSEAVEGLTKKIDSITEKFEKTASDLEELRNKFTTFDESLTAEKSKLADLEKKLDKINSSEAVKKSADFEKSAEKTEKATWDGAFSVHNLR